MIPRKIIGQEVISDTETLQGQTTTTITLKDLSKGFTERPPAPRTPPPFVPEIGIPFTPPPGIQFFITPSGAGGGFGVRPSKKVKQPKGLTPTLRASLFNITGKATRRAVITGLGERGTGSLPKISKKTKTFLKKKTQRGETPDVLGFDLGFNI